MRFNKLQRNIRHFGKLQDNLFFLFSQTLLTIVPYTDLLMKFKFININDYEGIENCEKNNAHLIYKDKICFRMYYFFFFLLLEANLPIHLV
jgi:hypothetical protein